MRREARLLLTKAINSLVLGIEMFNRPSDLGRTDAVLHFLDHAFEMLLKSAILHKGGKIREIRDKNTIGYDACLRKAVSDGEIKFLSNEQALLLQTINSLRDASQHHIVDVSEACFYIYIQSGVKTFAELLESVFNKKLPAFLPVRVLPISTTPPLDLLMLFHSETDALRKLISGGGRKGVEAMSKLRGLAIIDGSIRGEKLQPSQEALQRIGKEIKMGKPWEQLFPGVATLILTTEGHGQSMDINLVKKSGIPTHLVPEGTPGAAVVAVKRVDDLGFYNLGRDDLARHVKLSGPKTTAVIRCLKLQADVECYKRVAVGKVKFDRYSQKAIEKVHQKLLTTSIEEIWKTHGINPKK